MCNGSRSCDMLTTWHRWQCQMYTSTILSSPGNHTLVCRHSLVWVISWWPLCVRLTTLSHRVLGTMIHGPRTTSPPMTVKIKSYCRPECSLLFQREVSSSYGFLYVWQFSVWVCFFKQLVPVTPSGTDDLAMISFSNSSTISVSSNLAWLLPSSGYCECSLLHCSLIPPSFWVCHWGGSWSLEGRPVSL